MKRLVIVIMLIVNFDIYAVSCNGKLMNPITDVCWSCLFPISIGSLTPASSKLPDTKNPNSPVCVCPGMPPRPGLAIGYWEPIALVDVTRKPFCLVGLNTKMDMGKSYKMGKVNAQQGGFSRSFYDVHWYKFPFSIISDTGCMQTPDPDLVYMSEFDVSWHDPEIGFLLQPEAILFGNVAAQSACAFDALKVNTGYLPTSSFFWCQGGESTYPISGVVQNHIGGVQASTLLAERLTFKLHRLPILKDSIGQDGMLCNQYQMPIMPKDRYRYQMTFPLAANGRRDGCHPFGYNTALWEAGHEIPIKGEDFGYLIFRKRNCCAL